MKKSEILEPRLQRMEELGQAAARNGWHEEANPFTSPFGCDFVGRKALADAWNRGWQSFTKEVTS